MVGMLRNKKGKDATAKRDKINENRKKKQRGSRGSFREKEDMATFV